MSDASDHDDPAMPPGFHVMAAALSVLMISFGLVSIRLTRPSATLSRRSFLGLEVCGFRVFALFGGLVMLIGLHLFSFPMMPAVVVYWDACASRVVRTLLLPVLWAAERYLIQGRPLPSLQNLACVSVFVTTAVYQWGVPRPWDNVAAMMAGEVMGCNGGYRFWFQVYVAGFMCAAVVGVLLLFPTDAPSEEHSRHVISFGIYSPGVTRFRRKLLPVLFGGALAAVNVGFTIGAAGNEVNTILLCTFLLFMCVVFSFDWLWRQELTLGSWAPASQLCYHFVGYLQSICVFQDFRWAPDDETGFFSVHQFPGVWAMGFGITFMILLAYVYVFADDSVEWGSGEIFEKEIDSAESLRRQRTLAATVSARRPMRLLAIIIFPICMISVVLGITTPMIKNRVDSPHMVVGQGGTKEATHTTTTTTTPQPIGFPARSSFIMTLPKVYDNKMPASSIVVVQLCFFNSLMLMMHTLNILFRPSFVPETFQNWSKGEVVGGAKTRFLNPMVTMLGVAWINNWDPTGGAVKVGFGAGFWWLVLHALLTVSLGMALELDIEQLDRLSEPLPAEAAYAPVGEKDEMTADEELVGVESQSPSKSKRNVFIILAIIAGTCVALSMYNPFLIIQVRIGGLVTSRKGATIVDLWYSLMDSSQFLGIVSLITVVFGVVVWVPTLLLRLRNQRSRAIRIVERCSRHFVMGPQWMTAILLLYVVLSMHAGDPEAIVQVCYEFPDPPVGPLSILGMGVFLIILMGVGQSLVNKPQPPRPASSSGNVGVPRLPGGNGAWLGLAIVVFFGVFAYLTITGPTHSKHFENLRDVNNALAESLSTINDGLSKKVPESMGDCDALAKHRSESHTTAKEVGKCVGHAPIANKTHQNLHITAKWITGLNSIRIQKIMVMPPKHPPSWSAPDVAEQRWNFIVNGEFTDLHIWLKVDLLTELFGKEIFDNVWLNDNICCSKPINFTIQASAVCTPDRGFHQMHMDIPYLDMVDFTHVDHPGFMEALDRARLKTLRLFEAPLKTAFVQALRKVVKDKSENMRVQTKDDVVNPMVYISDMMESVLVLNTGHRCPDGNAAKEERRGFAGWLKSHPLAIH
eukprot:TRINITY_DN17934_c0_g3_i1.p1 TRINITY_DN17934_c0_g3~~TRINITY_DN17934_c0_g3_i1.p1  ORF type:complete len:1087 (+),score=121.49 TRINITY_DN17934_c0_g3_i1:41-3301(+)